MIDAPGTIPAEANAAVREALMLFVGDPDWLDEMTEAALSAAAPHLAAAERERIRQLAIDSGAIYICYSHVEDDNGVNRLGKSHPFADLLAAVPGQPHDTPSPPVFLGTRRATSHNRTGRKPDGDG